MKLIPNGLLLTDGVISVVVNAWVERKQTPVPNGIALKEIFGVRIKDPNRFLKLRMQVVNMQGGSRDKVNLEALMFDNNSDPALKELAMAMRDRMLIDSDITGYNVDTVNFFYECAETVNINITDVYVG